VLNIFAAESRSRVFVAVVGMLHRFAGQQIRNTAVCQMFCLKIDSVCQTTEYLTKGREINQHMFPDFIRSSYFTTTAAATTGYTGVYPPTTSRYVLCVFQGVGSNVVSASPVSDLNPLLLASGCILTLASLG